MNERILPTRMNLLRQRQQLAVARRGHKLMKDKLEALIRRFVPIMESYAELRALVDREFPAALARFRLAAGISGEEMVSEALRECGVRFSVDLTVERVLSVAYPKFELRGFEFDAAYSALTTTTDFDLACEHFRVLFPRLLELASAEEKLIRLSGEIERARRRVNALEYVQIPELEKAVGDISAKLEEAERSTRARLMKVKSLISGRRSKTSSKRT